MVGHTSALLGGCIHSSLPIAGPLGFTLYPTAAHDPAMPTLQQDSSPALTRNRSGEIVLRIRLEAKENQSFHGAFPIVAQCPIGLRIDPLCTVLSTSCDLITRRPQRIHHLNLSYQLLTTSSRFQMSWAYRPFILANLVLQTWSHPYDAKLTNYNININQTGGNKILSYSSDWPGKNAQAGYTPSPTNWRALPTYTVLLDKFIDGDPINNDYFNTRWEWDSRATQVRHGGDISGFGQDRVLDYIYGMGYRCIFFAGTPWINMPWQADGYSALDFTLLDPHYGTLAEWRAVIEKIHARGMYVMLDMTTTTMGDLIGNSKFLNASTPFSLDGYEVEWKNPPHAPWDLQRYADFNFTNTRSTCHLPNFYDNDGSQITTVDSKLDGCYAGDFDQFGDIEAFGVHADWKRQLSKFASVQDRLREWDDGVAAKLEHLACMTIRALDVDSMRIDKATQQTVDFVGKWGGAVKTCATSVGKNNFFIPGEITGGNTFGSLYIGRGRQPKNYANLGVREASLIKANQPQYFMRPVGQNGLDSAAFHYSIYRSLTRFLSMDGNLDVAYDVQVNWAAAWNQIFVSNDFVNHHTGEIDPRHLYGTSNQDVFRWPSLKNGTAKLLLGQFITNLVMPGIPLAYYGEEQDMYLYDSTASNYLYGRQAMSATRAWQTHGCYRVGSQQYFEMPFERALTGCNDEWNSLDHFDPTSPVRNVLSHFTHLRAQYPALQDGFDLVQRGNWTTFGQLPGSNQTKTEWGFWSVSRSASDTQQLTGPNANVTVWMLYSNLNETKTFEFDCGTQLWISAPYPAPITVRNLMYPYETYNLAGSKSPYYLDGKAPYRGCLQSVTMDALGFKVLVPVDSWMAPLPKLVTRVLPTTRESCRILIRTAILYLLRSRFQTKWPPHINLNSPTCTSIPPILNSLSLAPAATWTWSSQIQDAPDGIYEIIIKNPSNTAGAHTQSTDHLIIRKGSHDNPITFQTVAYSKSLLHKGSDGLFQLLSNAAGADLMRYSGDFGKTWFKWQPYAKVVGLPAGTFSDSQFWEGNHIRVQYWSKLGGSAAQAVDSDYGYSGTDVRTVPQLLLRGPFNQWGYDLGTNNDFTSRKGNWTFDIMTNWPNFFQVTPFDVHDEYYWGDVDGDGALDLLPPNTQAPNYLNLSKPLSPYLGWRIMVNQTDLTWSALPIGDESSGSSFLSCCFIKINKYGFKEKKGFSLNPFLDLMKEKSQEFRSARAEKSEMGMIGAGIGAAMGLKARGGARWPDDMTARRKVLIATLEYEITDWKLKVKIGGLGVMSSLMGKAMHDVDLLWVIPKVQDLEYPQAEPAPPIEVTIFGEKYLIELQIHRLDNITYYLLDSPVFRANTKSDPYPLEWTTSVQLFLLVLESKYRRNLPKNPDLDIYHINDYHGALVPLYLLPRVLPACLSLHNAEFQGLWPLRTKEEADEVCRAFNLSKDVCTKYVQFGNVFNLLHAAASFISHHQKSVGVAGVSDKYGKRSWARYPALWTLKTIDSLPNPDPTDIEALDEAPRNMKDVLVDEVAEAQRPEDKRKTQEWAGLHQDPKAQLFVFVGRWSLQKGVDLIADVFTTILEKRSDVQLVAVGPVVDLYGRFAAANDSTAHMHSQFAKTIKAALKSTNEERAVLRARSALQRFPVLEWRSRMENMHRRTIKASRKYAGSLASGPDTPSRPRSDMKIDMDEFRTDPFSRGSIDSLRHDPSEEAMDANLQLANVKPFTRKGSSPPGLDHVVVTSLPSPRTSEDSDPEGRDASPLVKRGDQDQDLEHNIGGRRISVAPSLHAGVMASQHDDDGSFLNKANRQLNRKLTKKLTITYGRHAAKDPFIPVPTAPSTATIADRKSFDSINMIMEEHGADSPLNQAIEGFTDENGQVTQEFIAKLNDLNSVNSKGDLCIAEYLVAAEKAYFKHVRDDKLAVAKSQFDGSTLRGSDKRPISRANSEWSVKKHARKTMKTTKNRLTESWELQVFSFHCLAVAVLKEHLICIVSGICELALTISEVDHACSPPSNRSRQHHRISNLVHTQQCQTSDMVSLSALGLFWHGILVDWVPIIVAKLENLWCQAPSESTGIQFLLLCIGSRFPPTSVRSRRRNRYMGISSLCSTRHSTNLDRCAVVLGVQITRHEPDRYGVGTTGLDQRNYFYSGNHLFRNRICPVHWTCKPPITTETYQARSPTSSKLCSAEAGHMVYGRRNTEGLLASGPYGRNWSFLWTGSGMHVWATVILVFIFFVGVWAVVMKGLSHASKKHTWFLPIFAVGLGAPRWCQMLWGTSSLATYLPWAGSAGPYLGTSLWLWLGVLDAVQGVGLGMILLQTLSRVHVAATLCLAQIIGSTAVIAARATAPNRIGPGNVFPDLGLWDRKGHLKESPLANWEFWVALACQLIIVAGYLVLFRREQLSKP
ncbi:hypothetical protein KEM48_003978 [Puccinia striiformis f. sp. tritici PST-130]|nr:hypothetical protein KEM48_003978 [Puccinia striiformis f. sp. tritici PST-130]